MADKVYAIQVVATKKGKPRKRKAWAIHLGWRNREWDLVDCSLHDIYLDSMNSGWTELGPMDGIRQQAEKALGCECGVVEITLTKRVVE